MSDFRILHLTDTHLYQDDSLHYGQVDTKAALLKTLKFLDKVSDLDLVVCSGDVSEDGSIGSYKIAQKLIGDFAKARGAETVFVPGNHDERSNFFEVLAYGQPQAHLESNSNWLSSDQAIFSEGRYKNYRVFSLDSTVPGSGYGVLDESQLSWLSQRLALKSDSVGSIIVLHHPPLTAKTKLLSALELQKQNNFYQLLKNSGVKLILAGHYHHSAIKQLAGIPLVVSAAIANQTQVFDDYSTETATFGSGGSLITLNSEADSFEVLPFQVPELRATEAVFSLDETTVLEIAARVGY